MKMLLLSVSFLSLLFYSVDSCLTVSGSGVSLTGVCPNDTFTVPIGTTLTYECSYNLTGGYSPFWNISGKSILSSFDNNPIPPGISSFKIGDERTNITILAGAEKTLFLQCRACQLGTSNCLITPKKFIGTEVITFGPPSLLHELRENDTVKLSWLPPLVEAVFTYNIIIIESTNNSLTVTDINITNNTYVIISPANITNYTECTSYQWGVRAAANLSYGFTNFNNTAERFTFTSAPNITNAMVTGNALSIIFELGFRTPAEGAYIYTLYQRDYCENQLNSTEINNILISEINDTMVSINIQSLIHDETWSVSVEVAVCQYNDTTQYINITNGNDTDRILDCKSDSLVSSTATPSLTLLPSISSMEYTSFFVSPSSSSSSSVTNTPSGTPVSGKSINITTVIGGVTGGVVVLILILIVAALIACKLKKRGSFNPTSEGENEGNDGRETFELEINDTADDGEAPTANTSVSIDDIETTDISNEGYERQTHLPGNPDPTYQEPLKALSQAKAVPPSATKPQEYSTPVNTPSTFAPQLSETKPAIDTELIQDTPGYTEVPAHMKKSTGSKKKQETKNQNDPLPLAPNDETEATPDSKLATHQYADLDEIRSRKGRPPPPTVINDVNYSEVITS